MGWFPLLLGEMVVILSNILHFGCPVTVEPAHFQEALGYSHDRWLR